MEINGIIDAYLSELFCNLSFNACNMLEIIRSFYVEKLEEILILTLIKSIFKTMRSYVELIITKVLVLTQN